MLIKSMVSRLILVGIIGISVGCGGKDKKVNTPSSSTGADVSSSDSSFDTPTSDNSSNTANAASLGEAIYFEYDSNDLTTEAKSTLEQNAEWLQEKSDRVLTIEGHTDEAGTPAYNLGLGEGRAAAAREYLLRLGIEPNRVKIITYGEERPAASDDSLNRRSMFVTSKN